MRAILTEEQEMLKATAGRIADSAAVTTPADLARLDRGAAWAELAAAGLLGMRVRGEDGAPMTSGVELMLVARSLAGALSPVPFVGVALAAELLARAGAPDAWVSDIAEGHVRYAVLLNPTLDGLAEGAGGVCIDAEDADYGLALAKDAAGVRLCRLPLAAGSARDGVDLTRPIALVDHGSPEPIGRPLSEADLQAWTALALTLVCADIVGVLGAGLTRVVDYAKTRIQYGAPIGSFQAVQHMCAEMLVDTQAAASLSNYAAWCVDAVSPAEALLAARTAKAYCAPMAQKVGEMLMQTWGGIGQVWEHEGHLRTRRAMFDRKLFGDEAFQLLAIAATRMERA
ncbi:MAG TPA: acyl-CoA dehydrogenase family protein [Caulobacteraceae bacterium]|nr:acyl-CoA dehydrogenase family protein [Caulobacteraceae bacterium]